MASGLLIHSHVNMRIVTVVFLLVASTLGQANSSSSPQDIVEKLMEKFTPDEVPPQNLGLAPKERTRAIQELERAQLSAAGHRSQQIAFLLAMLESNYVRNRNYLVMVMKGCDFSPIRNNCDERTAEYLIGLYERGHREVLPSLLEAGMKSDGDLAELLSWFYYELLTNHLDVFLDGIRSFPRSVQSRLCQLGSESSITSKTLKGLRKRMRVMRDDVAGRCLREIERANKH